MKRRPLVAGFEAPGGGRRKVREKVERWSSQGSTEGFESIVDHCLWDSIRELG